MRALIIVVAVLLVSCAPKIKPLYYWGDYEETSYKIVKGNEENDVQKFMKALQDVSEHPEKSSSGKIPPGVCADFAFFLMKQGKVGEGKLWLIREKELYPESAVFVDKILKMAEL